MRIVGFYLCSLACALAAPETTSSNVWQKAISVHRKLVISRHEVGRAVFEEKIRLLKAKYEDVIIPDRCFRYYLEIYEDNKPIDGRLWQHDYFNFDKSARVRLWQPEDTRFLDACYDDTNKVAIILLKQNGGTRAEIVKAGTDGLQTVCDSNSNLLSLDITAARSVQSGSIDCTDTNNWRITLTNSETKTSTFCWQGGKWMPQGR
jgi:hypothetical protein